MEKCKNAGAGFSIVGVLKSPFTVGVLSGPHLNERVEPAPVKHRLKQRAMVEIRHTHGRTHGRAVQTQESQAAARDQAPRNKKAQKEKRGHTTVATEKASTMANYANQTKTALHPTPPAFQQPRPPQKKHP